MKRKLLSVFLSLAMVLSLLPVSALAVDLTDEQKDALLEQGYTEEQIAELEANDKVMVVSEDTVLEEDYDGLILVIGKCTVTVKNAKVGVGVVVLPGAAEAKVVLTEKAEVNAVVVLDKAEVVVEAEAQTTYLTVAAPESAVTVAGAVDQLTVHEAAEAAAVTVAETATVAAVEVAAPAAAVEVAGTVTSVTVAETAAGAALTVSGAVESVAMDAPNTTTNVTGSANVGSVTVGESATGTEIKSDASATVGEVKDEGGNATVNGEPANSGDADTSDTGSGDTNGGQVDEPFIPPVQPEQPEEPDPEPEEPVDPEPEEPEHKADPGFAVAPLVDKGDKEDLVDEYSLSVSNGTENNQFRVVIKATEVAQHTATTGNFPTGYWVGLAIPLPETGTYSYYLINYKDNGSKKDLEPDSQYTDKGKTYDTFYFNVGVDGRHDDGGQTDLFQIGVIAGENTEEPEYIIDLAFDATLKKVPVVNSVLTSDDPADEVSEDDVDVDEETPAPIANEILTPAEGETPAPEKTVTSAPEKVEIETPTTVEETPIVTETPAE